MRRILQVVSCLEKGGTEAFIMNHFRNIDHDNYSFDFLVFIKKDYPYEDEIHRLGGNIYYCGQPNIMNIGTFIKNVVSCVKINGPYDAVHSHVNITNAWVVLSAMISGISIRISHSHSLGGHSKNLLRRLYTWVEKQIIKVCATHKIACSNIAGEWLYGKRYFQKHGQIIHNGINVDEFINVDNNNVLKLKKEFKISKNFVIGNISRFDLNKNISFIVDVFEIILRKIPDAVLLLGGVDGGQLKHIRRKVKGIGIEDNVRFIGIRDDIPDCLKLIDIYLFPSKIEGLGIALLEAQAAGVYAIASDSITKEVDVRVGLVNFMSVHDGAEKWANAIYKRINYKKPSNKFIKQKFTQIGYDIECSVKELESLYRGEHDVQ